MCETEFRRSPHSYFQYELMGKLCIHQLLKLHAHVLSLFMSVLRTKKQQNFFSQLSTLYNKRVQLSLGKVHKACQMQREAVFK